MKRSSKRVAAGLVALSMVPGMMPGSFGGALSANVRVNAAEEAETTVLTLGSDNFSVSEGTRISKGTTLKGNLKGIENSWTINFTFEKKDYLAGIQVESRTEWKATNRDYEVVEYDAAAKTITLQPETLAVGDTFVFTSEDSTEKKFFIKNSGEGNIYIETEYGVTAIFSKSSGELSIADNSLKLKVGADTDNCAVCRQLAVENKEFTIIGGNGTPDNPFVFRDAKDSVAKAPTVKTGLVYDGKEHELINTGEFAPGVDVEYVVSDHELDFSVKSDDGDPTTGGDNQNTGDDNQNTGDDNQNTGDDNQNTGDDNQNTGDDNQNTGDDNQNTGGDNQNTGDDNQNTGGDNQNTGDDNQSASSAEESESESAPLYNEAAWIAAGPSSAVPTKTNAGKYYVYYRTKASGDYTENAPALIGEVTIGQATATVTAPELKKVYVDQYYEYNSDASETPLNNADVIKTAGSAKGVVTTEGQTPETTVYENVALEYAVIPLPVNLTSESQIAIASVNILNQKNILDSLIWKKDISEVKVEYNNATILPENYLLVWRTDNGNYENVYSYTLPSSVISASQSSASDPQSSASDPQSSASASQSAYTKDINGILGFAPFQLTKKIVPVSLLGLASDEAGPIVKKVDGDLVDPSSYVSASACNYDLEIGSYYIYTDKEIAETENNSELDFTVKKNQKLDTNGYTYKYRYEINIPYEGNSESYLLSHDTNFIGKVPEGTPAELVVSDGTESLGTAAVLKGNATYYFGDELDPETDIMITPGFEDIVIVDELYFANSKGTKLEYSELVMGQTYTMTAKVYVDKDGVPETEDDRTILYLKREVSIQARPLDMCDKYLITDGTTELKLNPNFNINAEESSTNKKFTNGEKLDGTKAYTYTGSNITPVIVVVNPGNGNKRDIVATTDYTVTEDTTKKEPGNYTIKLTAKSNTNYTGSDTVNWKIDKIDLTKKANQLNITPKDNIVYDANPLDKTDFTLQSELEELQQLLNDVNTEITVYDTYVGISGALIDSADDLAHAEAENLAKQIEIAGSYQAAIKIENPHYVTIVKIVNDVDVAKRTVKVSPEKNSMVYGDGNYNLGKTVFEDAVDTNKDGIPENNSGVIAEDKNSFTAAPKNEGAGSFILIDKMIQSYGLGAKDDEFNSQVLANAGTYSYVLNENWELNNGNYTAVMDPDAFFTVEQKEITDEMFTVDEDSSVVYGYDGTLKSIGFKVAEGFELEEDIDFEAGGTSAAVIPGEYALEFYGINNYKGSAKLNWAITDDRIKLTDENITTTGICIKDESGWAHPETCIRVEYNGTELVKNHDYKILSQARTKQNGEFTVVIQGMGEFTGTATATVTVISDFSEVVALTGRQPSVAINSKNSKIYVKAGFDCSLKGKASEFYEIAEYGIIYANDGLTTVDELTLENADFEGGPIMIKEGKSLSNFIDNGKGVVARGYVTIKDKSGNSTVIYTDDIGGRSVVLDESRDPYTRTNSNKWYLNVGFGASIDAAGYNVSSYGIIYGDASKVTVEDLTLDNRGKNANVSFKDGKSSTNLLIGDTANAKELVAVGYAVVTNDKGQEAVIYTGNIAELKN